MQLIDPIDTHQFLKTGAARSRLAPQLARTLLRRIEALDYRPMPSDHCDAGPRFNGKIEESPGTQTLLDNLWKRIATEDLADLSRLFRAPAESHVTTILKLGDGYWLDWHNHLAARPTATLLLYLFADEDPGQGGDLLLGELEPDLKTIRQTERFNIAHGDAILIGDMSHPLLQHKAEPWHGPGWRYIVSFAFNSEDW